VADWSSIMEGVMVTTVANWVKPDGSQLIGYFWKTMSLLVCLALSSTAITNQIARQIVIPVSLKAYVLVTGHVAPVPRMCSIEQKDQLFVTLKLLLLNMTVLAYFLVHGTQGITGPNIESRMLNSLLSSFSMFSTRFAQRLLSTHHDKTDNKQYSHGRPARQLLLTCLPKNARQFARVFLSFSLVRTRQYSSSE
jgi:hypothetical protein